MANGTQKRNKGKDDDNFEPHLRYPRLNANAGKTRRAARRPTVARKTATPKARIRLDSAISSSSIRLGNTVKTRLRPVAFGSWGEAWRSGRIISFIGFVALFGVGYWLLTSPNFYVTRVEVKGSRYLNNQEVIRVAGLDKANIFLLNEQTVANRIQALPYVLEVNVSKFLPDKLSLQLTERVRVVNWKVGSLNYLVDAEGIVLESMLDKDLPADARSFPVIQSLEERSLKMGDYVDLVAVRSAKTIQTELTGAGIKIAAIQYSPTGGLVVASAPEAGSWKALLGTDAQLTQKINILKGLLADKTIKWTYADLRFVNKPAIQ